MADRKVNGKRIYSKGWSSTTRDVFHYCLEVAADSMGILPEMPAGIAEALSTDEEPITAKQVKKAIDFLLFPENPTLLRYELNGKTFLVFVNWQDNQHISYKYKPEYPCPPADVFAKLSTKTQELLAEHYGLSDNLVTTKSQPTDNLVRASVSVSVSDSVSVSKNTLASKSDTTKKAPEPKTNTCSWCENPTDWEADAPDTQRLMQVYHDGYKAQFHECPIISKSSGKDWAALVRVQQGRQPPRVRDVLTHAFTSEDDFLVQAGYALTAIAAKFQGIAIAFDRKEKHGAVKPRTGQPTTRTNPSGHDSYKGGCRAVNLDDY